MLLNCGIGEDSWKSLGLQGDPTSPSWRRSVLSVHYKDWCWSWNSNTLATWCEELTHLKRPRCWERLRAGEEGDDRGWDGWMAWPTQWTWVWVDSGSWWWTGRLGVLWFMGSQRVGHDWGTELNWCWERPKVGGEGDDRGWDGWMPSPTQWTWVWVSSGSWWCTGKPGVLQSMGSQRVRHNWATELNWYRFLNYSLNTSRSFLSQSFALASCSAWNSPSDPCLFDITSFRSLLSGPPLSTVSKSPADTLFLSLSISVPPGLFWFCFVSEHSPMAWHYTIYLP